MNAFEMETFFINYKHANNIYDLMPQADNIWLYAFIEHFIRKHGIESWVSKHCSYLSAEEFERELFEYPGFHLIPVECEFDNGKLFVQAFAQWIRDTLKKFSV